MNYVYLSSHQILGISHPPNSSDIVLWEQSNPYRRLTLTNNLSEHIEYLDRQAALALMMLKGLFGEPNVDNFHSSLNKHISQIREKRADSKTPVVVFEAHGEVEAKFEKAGKELDDFEVRWDVFDKDAVRESHISEVSASLSAIRVSTHNDCRFQVICDGSYLIKPDSKIVHSITAKMGSLNAYVSRKLSNVEIDRIGTFISSILEKPDICKVTELFSMALEDKRDRFQGFVTAWSALEILIGKLFRKYETKLFSEFSNTINAPGMEMYLGRVKTVMNGRYTLVDRFSVLSIFLGGDDAGEDIESFKKCKDIRDSIFHGKQISDELLPLEDVRALIDKYLYGFLEIQA